MSDLDDRVLRIGELRRMITAMRKDLVQPISKMKRADLLAHYRQLNGLSAQRASQEPKPKPRVKRADDEDDDSPPVPKTQPKKVPAKPAPAKREAPNKTTKKPEPEPEEEEEEPRPRGRQPLALRANSLVSRREETFQEPAPRRGPTKKYSGYEEEE